MEKETVQGEPKMSLGEKIKNDLCKKRKHEAVALETILPLFKGWKVCDATEVLYFAISEIQNNSVCA